MVQTENNLPDSSRVWVYQSNRAFTQEELVELKNELDQFGASWEAHGTKLNSAIEIYYNQFIVIFVDESGQEATGCSIDKSVVLVKMIESKYGISLLDRMNLTYKTDDAVENIRMADFQKLAQKGQIQNTVTVFNNLVISKAEFISKWEVEAKDSWHANLF
ncbi:MAG: hypothetical protein ACI9U0_001344 [Flavobacteriales bacterium]|jgi:hypothetical protein|tara:strand:+ start:2101 stop:2583 length:483 start_codon:yes stop_codon:yes gene_type:complete